MWKDCRAVVRGTYWVVRCRWEYIPGLAGDYVTLLRCSWLSECDRGREARGGEGTGGDANIVTQGRTFSLLERLRHQSF